MLGTRSSLPSKTRLSRQSLEDPWKELQADFRRPPFERHPRPLWFWNGILDHAQLLRELADAKRAGYAGVAILPAHGMYPAFMSQAFLEHYRAVVEEAARLGMKLCLYDEYWFPSGSAAGELAVQYPEALSKRLDLQSATVQGPSKIEMEIPKGQLMAAVAMELQSLRRIDLGRFVRDGRLSWRVPRGNWRVMLFNCVTDGSGGLVDYLDPEAVGKWVTLTYDRYYQTFPRHFGTTIDSAFYDEPTSWYRLENRAWTPRFNQEFQKAFGKNPALLYPALWFDIGPETAAARNLLFGLRAELYSRGFPKVLNDWCAAHKIRLTGHVDNEENVCPVSVSGDLMKSFRYQDIPGLDQIFAYDRGAPMYKIVSSAAWNYDRPLVMSETYGGIKEMPIENLYKEVMDQGAKGVNLFVPHAMWLDRNSVIFPPELSSADPVYGPHLPAYNRYVARLHVMLQAGRPVADLAMLYPIAMLQAGHYFAPGDHYHGGVTPPEADYMKISEHLSLDVHHDFAYLHPEIFLERVRIEGGKLLLENQQLPGEFRGLVLPGCSTISAEAMQKVYQFWKAGGAVLATACLPTHAAEPGRSSEVAKLSARIFGANPAKGGRRALFLKRPSATGLRRALAKLLPVPDVKVALEQPAMNGHFSYLHKKIHGREVYLFANSGDGGCDAKVQIRGRLLLDIWHPEDGSRHPLKVTHRKRGAEEVTVFELSLPAVTACFLCERKA